MKVVIALAVGYLIARNACRIYYTDQASKQKAAAKARLSQLLAELEMHPEQVATITNNTFK